MRSAVIYNITSTYWAAGSRRVIRNLQYILKLAGTFEKKYMKKKTVEESKCIYQINPLTLHVYHNMNDRDPVYVVGYGRMSVREARKLVDDGHIPPPSDEGRGVLELDTKLPKGYIVFLAGVKPAKGEMGKGRHGK